MAILLHTDKIFYSFLHTTVLAYSYLPNKWGDSDKRAGWYFPTNGEGGKNILIHKKIMSRVENFSELNKRAGQGWNFFLK